MITRRQFVLSATTLFTGCRAMVLDSGQPSGNPIPDWFGLGVASGDPAHDSVILWTRLTPMLSAAKASVPVDVSWVMARDPALHDVVGSGRVEASPEHAFCVHIEAAGLAPTTTYYYRFEAGGFLSPLGRTRTLPEPGAPVDEFRIALTSCQDYSQGYFSAYQDLFAMEPALVIHNGDYVYEAPGGTVRPYPIASEALTLDDYRSLYARYRQDKYLRMAHARFPWILIWDDHEVVNDWGPEHFLPSRYNEPRSAASHRARVTAARQAFLEHMPLRASLELHGSADPVFYRRDLVGDLVEICRLDVRSHRSPPVCNEGATLQFEACPEMHDSERSLLGAKQEQWLLESFGSSGCTWSCLVQATVMSPFDRAAGSASRYETDGWDNYAASRSRIIDHMRKSRIRNAISLGGNIHAYYAGSVTDTFGTGRCRDPVMTEIVTTSISARGGGDERYDDIHDRRAENPCLAFFENRFRGYTLLDIGRDRLRATFRTVDQITRPGGKLSTLDTISVVDGEIGIVGPASNQEPTAAHREVVGAGVRSTKFR